MRKFIIKLLLFSLPIIIGMLTLEIKLRNIPNDYQYKRNYLDRNAKNIEVLFLGNSHIYYGINPEYLNCKGFNGAHISQSLNFDYAILDKYENKWDKLKYIIIPIDYFSIFTTLEGWIENWRIKNYAIYYGIYRGANFYKQFEIFNDKLPENFKRVRNIQSNVTCNKFGFGTNFNSKNSIDLIESGESAAKRHTINLQQNKATFDNNIRVIHAMIDFAKRKKIKIIFITCPAYATYTRNLNNTQLAVTVNAIKKIAEMHKHTHYFNLLTDSTFLANDYFDADHLNEKGAKKLTLKIDSLINITNISNIK